MFKNVRVCQIGAEWTASLSKVEDEARKAAFLPCEPTQPKSLGFAPARGIANGALIESVGGQWMVSVTIEQRVLPGVVVKKKLEERLAEIQERTGRKVGKKEKALVKDELTRELLPKAFCKQQEVRAWIDPAKRLLFVDAASKSKFDDVTTLLATSLESFKVVGYQTAVSPQTAMTQWLLESEAPSGFVVDDECELKTIDEAKSAVKYSRHNLDLEEIKQHLQTGKRPTKVAMTWEGRVSFVLTDDMQLKKLQFLDVVFAQKDAEADPFDANSAIMTGELSRLFEGLVEGLGGRLETGGTADGGNEASGNAPAAATGRTEEEEEGVPA